MTPGGASLCGTNKEVDTMAQPRGIGKADYIQLFSCRLVLRRFLSTSVKVARHLGLTGQQHELLLAIKSQPERDWSSMGELAESLGIRHSSAVELVERCEQMGLVLRQQNPNNRRQVRVSLTENAEALLLRLAGWHRRELELLQEAMHERAVDLFNSFDADAADHMPLS
jgi:DNA-binding MarR family transcriptional regulator